MREIIGVVGNVREGGLDDELWPTEYEALYQSPGNFVAAVVRTSGDEKAILPSLIKAVHEVDPTLGTYGELTMQDQMNTTQSALIHHTAMWVVDGFAAIALVLAVVGLYGVIAYSMGQRTREIGVRMALGAQRSAVYSMVMRQAGWLTAAGYLHWSSLRSRRGNAWRQASFRRGGLGCTDARHSHACSRIASLAASFLPAHRAASVNPTEALRAE